MPRRRGPADRVVVTRVRPNSTVQPTASLRLVRIVVTFIAALLVWHAASAQGDDKPRLLMISLDGVMPSAYTAAQPVAPTLAALAHEGAWAEGVVGVLPTVTYPSHTTLITGVPPAVHGIVDNTVLDPENRSNGAWYYYASDIKVPTLPMAARSRGLRTAAVSWPVTAGMPLDYLVPEYLRSSHEDNLKLVRLLSTPPALLDAVETSRDMPFRWPMNDRDRTDIAAFILKIFDPHVLLLHLFETDSAAHTYGPGSPEATEAIRRVDGYVKELVDIVRGAGRADRTHIAIVSDHGFLPVKTQLQPNALFKQERLLETDAAGRVTAWQAYFRSSGGSGVVHVKDPASEPRVWALLEAIAKNPANGVRRLWTRADLAAKGANPDAAFGLDVMDGFYTGAGTDTLLRPATSRGGHGFDPERPALHASFILAGPAVRARGSLGVITMTRIAPTLASLLGVGLSPLADRPLDISGTK